MLPGALRPATAKAAQARAQAAAESGWPDDPADLRKSRKRTAELAAVADIPPAPRTADDILAALFGPRPPRRRGRHPRPAPGPEGGGQDAVRIGPQARSREVIADAFAEARPPRPRPRPALDRRRGRQQRPDRRHHRASPPSTRSKVTILIDLIHVVQYLWKAASSFFYPGDPAARAWVRDQAAKILAGKHRDVRAGIRRRATAFGYSPAERAGADACARYLENKQDYLDYPAFLDAGWPVASGLIEGAAAGSSRTAWKSPAPDGASTAPKPSSSSAPSSATATSTTTSHFHLKQEKLRNHDSRYQQPQAPRRITIPPEMSYLQESRTHASLAMSTCGHPL